jgi:hypothetical protein
MIALRLFSLLLNPIKNYARVFATSGGFINAWYFFRARRAEVRGRYSLATELFEKAMNRVDSNTTLLLYKIRQFWQFYLERSYHLAGLPRVEDPLFWCTVSANHDFPGESTARKAVGRFETEWSHLGLRIDGFLYDRSITQVYITLDGQTIRSIGIRRPRFSPGYFHYHLSREVVAQFPKRTRLQILVPEVGFLMFRNAPGALLEVPHGTGTLLSNIKQGATINKKGFFTPSKELVIAKQNRYLQIYSKVNEFFLDRYQKPLVLLYGTLLGLYRQGDFIPGDDDFDAGYVSTRNTVAEVKEELKAIVIDLVLAGFCVSFNRRGRLFRIRLPGDQPGVHLDLRPLWYEENGIWAHLQAYLPLKLDDFVPVESRTLRGIPVNIPRHSERFLEAYYGPGWKVPDPTYSNTSKIIPRKVLNKLASLCILPEEFKSMTSEIEEKRKDYPRAGTFVSNGTFSLYPLDQYEANCDW